ncbi:MAG: ABC transporter permease [Clostridia bacterium]|nr:ABC transporter permease [Clostridia bacterium]
MNTSKSPKFQRLKIFFSNIKREFIKNKNIVGQLVKRNVKVQYRNSAIGILWTVLNPLLNMLVMYLVFGTIFGYSSDKTYVLYLLCGNIIFNTMRGATTQSMTSLVNNRGLLTKNKIAFQVFPLSCNISAIVNLAFSYIALLIVMMVVDTSCPFMHVFSLNMFKAILMIPAFFLFIYGVSLVLAAAYVYFRDILHYYNIFLTLWMYMTPIFYKTNTISGNFGKFFVMILKCNPMVHFVEYFRAVTYRMIAETSITDTSAEAVKQVAAIKDSVIIDTNLLTLYGWGIAFFVAGLLIFSASKRNFMYKI